MLMVDIVPQDSLKRQFNYRREKLVCNVTIIIQSLRFFEKQRTSTVGNSLASLVETKIFAFGTTNIQQTQSNIPQRAPTISRRLHVEVSHISLRSVQRLQIHFAYPRNKP
ncbi:hypothetical protein CEXT_777891 [Caerostris extrusa]|uniref:Uncharacterized protein n=1 Tax=Caerostris extrusa TaxID=172846 RepID=A0AAV4R6H6_CAEEX|nr:hypothetical protein CEXT_777891 [Caerostris extrusa]